MKIRKLGQTDLQVPALSFGASSLGSVFRQTDENESIRTVHTAIDCGMNYIDVSPYYGLTKAEAVLGKGLKGIQRDRYLLSTKAGRIGENKFDFRKKSILLSVEDSLKRLGTDYADIVFLHDVEFEDPAIIIEEAMPALMELKEQGKIRYAGISGLPLDMFRLLLPQIKADVVLSYCHYSLNDTSLLDLLPLLEELQVDLVNASPLSMGLLGMRGAPDWHPASAEIKEKCKEAAAFCEAQGEDIAKLAMQFATANDQIPTTLVSTASIENVKRNAAWVQEPMNEELLAEVQRILAPIHNLSWASGRDEYNSKHKEA